MTWSTDVLVCGSGLAGHCAALAAAECGAEVVLIEKTASAGGSSALAGGGFAFAGTDLQAARGIVDGPEALRRDMSEVGGGKADPALIETYVARQLETYEWLRSNGVVFSLGISSTPGAVPRVHSTAQGAAIKALHMRVEAENRIQYVDRTAAGRLITVDGAVVGALVNVDGAPKEIQARKGVILATGGFSRSARLIETYAPGLSAAFKLGGTGNTGDGLLMAGRVGAGQADMGYITATFGVAASRFFSGHRAGTGRGLSFAFPDLPRRHHGEPRWRTVRRRIGKLQVAKRVMRSPTQRHRISVVRFEGHGAVCLDVVHQQL
ncbi:succinate dehydrogenase/fumarate reductase flavoprotein subunit [Bradyrhizobium ottawaense]